MEPTCNRCDEQPVQPDSEVCGWCVDAMVGDEDEREAQGRIRRAA